MYKYETHCHTWPVSNCARASVEDTLNFYKKYGYDGIFLTNHFLDGNINREAHSLPFRELIDYYFSDYEAAAALGKAIGIKVFPGVELSYRGTDFLIYGLEKEWYKSHPEILGMEKTEELALLMDAGAFIIQAHPYREAYYIDHIRLYPRSVHGVEVINSNQSEVSNEMADLYADRYRLLKTAGSDNHWGAGIFERFREKGLRPEIALMGSDTEINSIEDFIRQVKSGRMKLLYMDEEGNLR